MFQSLGNLASLLRNAPDMLRQAQQMQSRMQELQEKLGRLRLEGSAGGGMVTVTANGQQKIVGVVIDESVVSRDDREMLEDLIRSATNQALEKAREAASTEMAQMMGTMEGLPGLGDVLSRLRGGPDAGSGPSADPEAAT